MNDKHWLTGHQLFALLGFCVVLRPIPRNPQVFVHVNVPKLKKAHVFGGDANMFLSNVESYFMSCTAKNRFRSV